MGMLATGMIPAGVDAARETEIGGKAEEVDMGKLLGDEIGGAVGAGVVDDDDADLDAGIAGFRKGMEAIAEASATVVAGDEEDDLRHIRTERS